MRTFEVEFVLLPVRDRTVRQAPADRFLVPESFYDGPEWPGWLANLVGRMG